MDTEIYQDIRIQGRTVWHGRRECETRWTVLQAFLERYKYKTNFKVLDFGANFGYFSWRIKEDYPHAEVDIVDSRPLLRVLDELNSYDGVTLYENMDTTALRSHAENHYYDLILAMSILHHFDNYDEILSIFKEMSDTIIIETDYPDTPNFKGNQKGVYEHLHKYSNPIQLNTWLPHDRPIYYISKGETPIEGVVAAGQGKATVSLSNIKHLFDWIHLDIIPGTLNLGLFYPLHINWTIRVGAYEIYPLTLNGLPVFALQDPRLPNPYRLELISPYHLRSLFNLNDNQSVILSVDNINTWELRDKPYNYDLEMYLKILGQRRLL